MAFNGKSRNPKETNKNHRIVQKRSNLRKNKPEKRSFISPLTKNKVLVHLKNGDQVLFFVNRRGYAPHAMCVNCIKVFSCPNCSINLVFHKRTNKLHCH